MSKLENDAAPGPQYTKLLLSGLNTAKGSINVPESSG